MRSTWSVVAGVGLSVGHHFLKALRQNGRRSRRHAAFRWRLDGTVVTDRQTFYDSAVCAVCISTYHVVDSAQVLQNIIKATAIQTLKQINPEHNFSSNVLLVLSSKIKEFQCQIIRQKNEHANTVCVCVCVCVQCK